jgi:DNA-binding response OmpR family regulator
MLTTHADRLLKATHSLRAQLLAILAAVDEVSEAAEQIAKGSASPPSVTVDLTRSPLRVDRSTFAVRWQGKVCPLGNTTAFRLLERLARRPDEYISIDQLLDDLWSAPRSYSTLRSTICRLKSKLDAAGMRDLASRINGRVHGYYALRLKDE